MTPDQPDQNANMDQDFAQQASERAPSVFAEFWAFLRYNKKWWLGPILVVLLLVALLVILAGSPLAPFIYTIW
jgi:hypothetical protein